MEPSKIRTHLHDLDQDARDKIQELYPGVSIRRISRALGVSRKLIRHFLADRGLLQSIPVAPSSKLDPFREAMKERVAKGLTTTRILRELKELGYQGGRTILAQEVSTLRMHHLPGFRKPIKRRFETPAGLEAQVDWSPGTVMIAGQPTPIHVLGIVLAHCRKLFYAVYRQERLPILLEGLATGFAYFGGVTKRVMFDRMSTVVLGTIGSDRKPIWNPRFIEFCRHYAFEPALCAARDPDRKGKKEKAFRLVFDDFLKGSMFESWDDLQQRLYRWLDQTPAVGNLRTHGTTGLVPNEAYLQERPFLTRLPEQPFPTFEEEPREVDQTSTLSVRGIRYTVPAVLGKRQAIVRLHAHHFEVFDSQGRLHMSRKYLDSALHPEKLVIDSTHYAGLKRPVQDAVPGGAGQRLDQAFIKCYPTLAPLVDGLKAAMKGIAQIHLRHLLRLAGTYGQEAFLAAATKAQEHRRFDAYAVKRILEREHPLPEEDLVSPSSGLGPMLLGEVKEPDLERFAHLDTMPTTETKKDQNDENE